MKGVQIVEWESNDSLNTMLQGIDTVLLTCTIGILNIFSLLIINYNLII